LCRKDKNITKSSFKNQSEIFNFQQKESKNNILFSFSEDKIFLFIDEYYLQLFILL